MGVDDVNDASGPCDTIIPGCSRFSRAATSDPNAISVHTAAITALPALPAS